MGLGRLLEPRRGVRELAEAVGLSRSTVNRILQGLTERRLARVDANATYSDAAVPRGTRIVLRAW